MINETNKLYKYLIENSSQEDDILKKVDRETHLKTLNPRMISGHLQGMVLNVFCQMIRPKNILEIGTFTAYSAICLAQSLGKEGVLDTIEINDEMEIIIRDHLKEANVHDKVNVHFGNAIEIIPKFKKKFDLVFIDADKKEYSNYYNMVFNLVKPGGFIIADNVLWNGKVIENIDINDKDTLGIVKFNKMVTDDSRVHNFILPIRDGLMIIRKE